MTGGRHLPDPGRIQTPGLRRNGVTFEQWVACGFTCDKGQCDWANSFFQDAILLSGVRFKVAAYAERFVVKMDTPVYDPTGRTWGWETIGFFKTEPEAQAAIAKLRLLLQ